MKQTHTSKYNRRVSLQSATTISSLTGEPEKTWSTYATVWAAIRTLSGRERNAAQQVQATQTHEVTIRYSSEVADVTPKDRILYGSRIFDIQDVRNIDETNIEIRMLCAEAAD